MLDQYGRKINYLRVSVTDLCNLRCIYCMPAGGVTKKERRELLTFEEIENIVRAAAQMGVDKVRITGGEPLVRKGIVELVDRLARIDGIEDLSMTTNGILLKDCAAPLKEAGLKRVNISLDTLDPDKYHRITRRGHLADVLAGMEAARAVGLTPIKVNVVLVGGLNDDEIEDFVNLTLREEIQVRFIELMPLGEAGHWERSAFLPTEEVLRRVPQLIPLAVKGHGTVARLYQLPHGKGQVGLISPLSNHFCQYCNRLRVTPDGKLKSCLHSSQEINLKNVPPEELPGLLAEGIRGKPHRHYLSATNGSLTHRNMNEIGG
ncbi:MAG TPA: GTP 3',8-cyclase MoaA [Clostridia bacterium]|nr:GTP 3',8-cyclase MoaA [Clostridia bacterium]